MERRAVKQVQFQKRLLYAALSFIVIALFLIIFLLVDYQETSLVMGFGISFILCIIPFIYFKRDPRLTSPIYYTMGYILIAYHLKFIAVRMNIPDVSEGYPGLLWRDALVSEVFMVLACGIISFYLGYYATPKIFLNLLKNAKLPFYGQLNRAWTWKVLLIFLIGLSSIVIQFISSSWSSFAGIGKNWDPRFNQLFSYTFDYIWIAVISSFLWFFSNQNKQPTGKAIHLVIILGSMGLLLFFLGSKTWIISMIIWAVMCFYATGHKISFFPLILGITVIALFAFTFVPVFRGIFLGGYQVDTNDISTYIDTGLATFNELKNNPIELSKSAGTLLTRFGGVDNAAFIINSFPHYYNFRNFRDLLVIPFGPIPRIIFPMKPTSDLIGWYSQEIVGGRSAAAAHPVGEGYLEFGWIGVIVLFWLWGLIQSLWYRGFYLPREKSPIAIVLYIFFILGAIGFGEWILGYILKFSGRLIVLIPLIFILNYGASKKFIPEKTGLGD
jgi:hypothetical protein